MAGLEAYLLGMAQRARGSRALHSDQAATGNPAAAGEQTLKSYTMPGGTLARDGQGIRITVTFASAANGNSKTSKIYFGSSQLAGRTAADNNQQHILVAEVYRVSASAQNHMGRTYTSGASVLVTRGLGAEDLTGDVVITVKAQSAASQADDLTNYQFTVEKISN